jgi:purine-nucleoside phosphorylase
MSKSPTIAIVAGSGIDLNGLLNTTDRTTPFTDYSDLAPTTVIGHAGQFTFGTCADTPIILQTGRLHFYEGYDFNTVTRTVDCLHDLGADLIIFTNATGGLRPEMNAGHLMAAKELTLWPCTRWEDSPEKVTPTRVLEGCDSSGTCTWIHGPTYETQAEIHALQARESDAVGMSTAPEIHRCNQLGIESASIACITNNCCSPQTLTHEHVIEIAHQASQRIQGIIRTALPKLAQELTRQ